MASISVQRVGLLAGALQACVEEYRDKRGIFASLDTKAHNTTAIAGIFLAAALAFLHGNPLKEFVRPAGLSAVILLAASVLVLLGSIVTCLWAMRVRYLVVSEPSETLVRMVNDILRLESSEFTDKTGENFLRDQINTWQKVLRSMSVANQNKAKATRIGQVLLVIAIACVAILLLIVLISVAWAEVPQT